MTSLIQDLETAKAGSRELDCGVAYAFGWRHSEHDEADNGAPEIRVGGLLRDMTPSDCADIAGVWRPPEAPPRTFENDRDPRYVMDPPRFTRSLDNALALVPGGMFWSAGHMNSSNNYKGGMAFIWAEDNKKPVRVGRAKTPALALCAAILRAKQHEEET